MLLIRIKAEKAAAEEQARVEAEKAPAEEQARVEAEKAAAEEKARVEAEKAAAEEQARIEAEKAAEVILICPYHSSTYICLFVPASLSPNYYLLRHCR